MRQEGQSFIECVEVEVKMKERRLELGPDMVSVHFVHHHLCPVHICRDLRMQDAELLLWDK